MPPPRVLSLLPSCTEIVFALGAGDTLVGCSHECDYPPETSLLPVCTKPEFDSSQSSARIERDVQNALKRGLSLYTVDLPLIAKLKPDVILTQAQCEVCAVSLEQIQRDLASALDYKPKLVSLQPTRLAHLWDNIYEVAEAVGVPDQARPVIKALKNRLVDIIQKTAEITGRPRVGCIEWTDPLMAAGHWVPDLVEMAGGICAFGQAGEHSPRLSWEELLRQNPEILVVLPCGFDLPRAIDESLPLVTHPDWRQLRAPSEDMAYIVDGRHYFNRPGPRLIDSIQILTEILHPSLFGQELRSKAWETL